MNRTVPLNLPRSYKVDSSVCEDKSFRNEKKNHIYPQFCQMVNFISSHHTWIWISIFQRENLRGKVRIYKQGRIHFWDSSDATDADSVILKLRPWQAASDFRLKRKRLSTVRTTYRRNIASFILSRDLIRGKFGDDPIYVPHVLLVKTPWSD